MRRPVKKLTLVVLLVFSALAWAGSEPKPADYRVNVHVSSSRLTEGSIRLKVILEGKKYELQGLGGSLIPATIRQG